MKNEHINGRKKNIKSLQLEKNYTNNQYTRRRSGVTSYFDILVSDYVNNERARLFRSLKNILSSLTPDLQGDRSTRQKSFLVMTKTLTQFLKEKKNRLSDFSFPQEMMSMFQRRHSFEIYHRNSPWSKRSFLSERLDDQLKQNRSARFQSKVLTECPN